tara:strand:- start:5541 stop:7397 length:1857 start_codon:yes stop_codon:yes gene_type:complete
MKKIIINCIDEIEDNNEYSSTYYWNGFGEGKYYLNNFIETNKEEIRNIYLEFIENFENKRKFKSKFSDIFTLNDPNDLWHMSSIYEKCPNRSYVTSECIKLLAIDKLLSKEKPDLIELITSNININKSIKELCEKKKINFICKSKNFVHFNSFKNLLKIRLLKTIYFIFRNFLDCFKINQKKVKFFKNSICLVSYLINFKIIEKKGDHIFFSDYYNDLPELLINHDLKINWLHFEVNKMLTRKFNQSQNINSRLDNQNYRHSIVGNMLDFGVFFSSLVVFIKITFKIILIRKIKDLFDVENTNVNFSYFLKDDWVSSSRGSQLFFSIIMIKLFDKLFSKMPRQNFGIFLLENQAWEKAFLSAWKRYSHGKLIGIDHTTGLLRYWDLRFYKSKSFFRSIESSKYLPDFFGVNGPASKDNLLKSGFPKTRIIENDALRFNYLQKYIDLSQKHVEFNNKILLIGDIDYYSTKKLLDDVQEISNFLDKKTKLIFRPHPGTKKIKNLINSATKKNFSISELPLIEEILKSDTIIVAGSSSVSVESYLLNKNVLVYLDRQKLNINPINSVKSIKFTSDAKSLLQAIKNKSLAVSTRKNNLFWLNLDLNKWKSIIESKLINDNSK